MTLIAGFVCPDGLVIAADTEIELGDVRFQQSKLIDSPASQPIYRLILGGAGWSDYIDETMQDIRDEVAKLGTPRTGDVDEVIRNSIARIHEQNIFMHWEPGDRERPSVSLIVGLRDVDGHCCLWKTNDKTVSVVTAGATFVGSGIIVANYVSEKLFRSGLPTAVVHHLATQILREARSRGSGVGGHVETWSIQAEGAAPYFDLGAEDAKHLWHLETALFSAVRCALTGRNEQLAKRSDFVAKRLGELAALASRPLASQSPEWHTVEIATDRDELH